MRKSGRIRYEVDPLNRLVIPRFRTVLDGEFEISKDNFLFYRVKAPSSSPLQQLKLSGNWSLDNEHNLVLSLDKENNQLEGDRLTLEGQLIDAKADELVFGLSSGDSAAGRHFYLLKLAGKWQADEHNRLCFLVSKENSSPDILTLRGSWEVNRQNEIVYTYIHTGLKRKDKFLRTLTFKGHWDMPGKKRILYVLNQELGSGFDFRVSVGKPAAKGLEYEIGFGAKPAKKKFLVFGSWKIDEKIGLIFEMPAEAGKILSIAFGASCKLTKGYELELKLKDYRHQDLGIEIRLSRKFLNGLGQAYLQALKDGRELSLVAGVGIRW